MLTIYTYEIVRPLEAGDTIQTVPATNGQSTVPPVLRVRAQIAGEWRNFQFTTPVRIGRTETCDLQIDDGHVSREHAETVFENEHWLLRDLRSANGIYVNGERVETVQVAGPGPVTVRLGIYGPAIELEMEPPPPAPKPFPVAPVQQVTEKPASHYFGNPDDQSVGDHTRMVRRAIVDVQVKQKRKYGWVIAALGVCALGAIGFGLFEHFQAQKQRNVAESLFYAMKSLDVDIANVEKLVAASGNQAEKDKIRESQKRRQGMEEDYNQFLSSLKVYDPKMSEEDKLVLRVARIFGECEIAMPPEFLAEVKVYIKKWQSSGRYLRAVRLAAEKGYTQTIAQDMLDADLPPQFFYLGMQESDFDAYISGPMTRKGIAKGMWQFIPETAVKYGMKVGPLVDLPRPDPGDDRHHWDRETLAAAAYMKDLYSSDAQASGLLVMACYNWGEKSVLPLVRSMPANPRERNFWKLLEKYRDKIPQETYDYVFYIVSAAAIGENPRLFGIQADNPLGHLERK